MNQYQKRRGKKWIAAIPNFFTLFNLTLGFFSILIASNELGNLSLLSIASGFIFLAVLLDGLDGAVARLLRSDSPMGAQLDSLADLITSGIAPGFLMFSYVFYDFSHVIFNDIHLPMGMLYSGIWPMCAAYRLSRFNTRPKNENEFCGLPAPAAAVAIATVPIVFSYFSLPIAYAIGSYFFLSFLMVSTTRFPKPQAQLFLRFSKPRAIMIIAIFLLMTIYVSVKWNMAYGSIIVLIPLLIYLCVGLITFLIEMIQKFRF